MLSRRRMAALYSGRNRCRAGSRRAGSNSRILVLFLGPDRADVHFMYAIHKECMPATQGESNNRLEPKKYDVFRATKVHWPKPLFFTHKHKRLHADYMARQRTKISYPPSRPVQTFMPFRQHFLSITQYGVVSAASCDRFVLLKRSSR